MSKIVDYSINLPEVVVEAKRGVMPSSVNAYNQAAKGLAVFDKITPPDTYKDSFAQAVTPSNEIDYAQSNADRVINDYKDSELVNVVNSLKQGTSKTPIIDEDVEIIDTTKEYEPPTEEMNKFEEEKTQAQWQKDYLDSIYSQADYEADEKKKKAAQWITAAQMLGDSLTALGNSYFTAKGANNMGASQGAAKAAEATSKLHEDIRNARERAAKTKYELEKARKEWEYRKEKDKQAQDNADRDYNFRVKQHEDTQAQRKIENTRAEKLLKIQEKNADSTAKRADAYAKRQAWLNAGGGTSKHWMTPISIKDENGKDAVGYINTKGLTETNLQQIADTLPNDVKEKYGLTGNVWQDSQVLGTFDDKVARAIGEVVQDTNSETYKYMDRLGLIEVSATMPSSDKPEGGGKSLGLTNVNGK